MSSQGEDQNKKNPPANVNDAYLSSLKTRSGKETANWMANLTDEAVHDLAEAAAKNPQPVEQAPETTAEINMKRNQSMLSIMDQMFDAFQQYEFDFNKSVAGSDLVMHTERPTKVIEHIKQGAFSRAEAVPCFRGRLSTRYWTLLLRGQTERIEGWVLPIDKIISFSGDQQAFVRFFEMASSHRGGEPCWMIENQEVPMEQMRALAKQLFGHLVQVAKGDLSPEAPFRHHPQPARQESMAQAHAQPALQAAAQPMHAVEQPAPPAPALKESQRLQRPAPKEQKQTGSNSTSTAASSDPRHAEHLAQTAPISIPSKEQLKEQKATQKLEGKQSGAASKSQATDPRVSLDAAAASLQQALTLVTEKVAAKGAQAFASQDLKEVDAAMKRSIAMKELSNEMLATFKKWRQSIEENL